MNSAEQWVARGRLSGADLSCYWPRLTCEEAHAAWRIWGFVCQRDDHDPIFLPLLETSFDDSEHTQTPDLHSYPQCWAVMQSSKDGQWLWLAGKNKHISLVTRSPDFSPCNFISSMVTSKGVLPWAAVMGSGTLADCGPLPSQAEC